MSRQAWDALGRDRAEHQLLDRPPALLRNAAGAAVLTMFLVDLVAAGNAVLPGLGGKPG